MDINTSIRSTIDALSARTHVDRGHAEIAIDNTPDTDGGREAAGVDPQKMVDTLNRAAATVDTRVSFDYNKDTRRVIMKIVDPDTQELVRQIPSREMIRLLERIHEMTGLLLDETR
ncbi:MAG: flagellar protein FlaG [Spirochaetota bacterium]